MQYTSIGNSQSQLLKIYSRNIAVSYLKYSPGSNELPVREIRILLFKLVLFSIFVFYIKVW